MTITQTVRIQDIANRATAGRSKFGSKPPVCVEITPATRVGNGAVVMCKNCFGTSVCYNLNWIASGCTDCGEMMDKIGGYWLLKRGK